ncbi:hypothetical protein D3C71_1671930 [compost metagenome]
MFDNEEYKEYCRQLDRYNWDDGFEFPQSLLSDSGCDLALALKIFYLADGYGYLQRFIGEEPSGSPEWLAFMDALYARLVENQFPAAESRYPGRKHPYQIPLSKVQRFRLRKANVPDVFIEDV